MSGMFRQCRRITEKNSVFRGLVYSMLSGVAFSLLSVIVKHMKNMHPGQLALYRFIGLVFMVMPEAIKTGESLLGPRKFWFLLLIRGIVGALYIFFSFLAFRYLELGEASVIILSSPVVVTIFARVFLKEPCNILQSITVTITIIGIIFTAKLPSRLTEKPFVYTSEKIIGLLAATCAVFCVTSLQLLTRKLRSVHHSILIFTFSSTAILLTATLTAIFGNFRWHQCGIQSIYMLLIALFSYAGTKTVILALQCEYAGPVSTMRAAVDIALAFLWQILFFHDQPDSYGIIGAVLVSISIILIGFDKWLTTLESNFFSCEKLKCLFFC